jgi:hypothetical protein
MKRGRASHRLLAVVVACLIHAALFTALVFGRRAEPVLVESPAFSVTLVSPPLRTLKPPTPDRKVVEASPIPPVVLPQAKAPPAVSDDDRAALAAAPFVGFPGLGAILRAQRSCLNGAEDEKQEEDCYKLFGKGRRIVTTPGDADQQAEFAAAVQRKAGIRHYKDSKDFQSFPGLRCSFGRPCSGKPFDGPGPGAPMTRR